MNIRIQSELDILSDIIVNTIPVEQIILFGSYANDTSHPDSDIDLYVVMKDDTEIREIDAIRLIRRAIRDEKTMPVDIMVSSLRNFKKRQTTPSIERGIAEEGQVLYGKII